MQFAAAGRAFRQVTRLPRMSTLARAQVLSLSKNGEPLDVLELKELDVSDPSDDQVTIAMLAAPVNPRCADTWSIIARVLLSAF
jgi:hypothetical protein